MWIQQFATSLRAAPALALAANLLVSTLGPPTPVRASQPIVRDHREIGRLEVAVNKVHVIDDRDWGEGEIRIRVSVLKLRECPESERGGLGFCHDVVATGTINFGADSGETVVLNRVVPGPGDEVADGSIGPGIGFPVSAGPGYLLAISGYEIDAVDDDALGVLSRRLSEQNGWGPLGTYDERGAYCEIGGVFPHHSDCGNLGKYSVEYEIRRVPLPDLQPTAFRVAFESPGDRDDLVCFTVQNRGPVASEPFRVNLHVDGALPPSRDIGAFGLAAGETREQCTGLRMPDSGSHQLTMVVDQPGAIPEMDERNNVLERLLVHTKVGDAGPVVTAGNATADPGAGAQPSGGPAPTASEGTSSGPIASGSSAPNADPAPGPASSPKTSPAPSQAQPDLMVSAIRINGQAPDGKDDCKDGKNDLAVVVKNQGPGAAAGFVARIQVGDDSHEQTVASLDAGKEQEIRFDDIRLKKGTQRLTAVADAKGAVAESNEENNERKATAGCKDG